MDVKIKGREAFQKFASQLGVQSDEYRKGLKIMMWRALGILEAQMIIEMMRRLDRGTGRLLNAITQGKAVKEDGNTIVGEIGPEGVPYAGIHEFGGIIKPKKAKYLAIPQSYVKGPDGVARAKPHDFKGEKTSLVPLKRGGFMMLLRTAKEEQIPLFVFKKEVKIPKRPYIRPALQKKQEQIAEKFALFISTNFDLG